jgi:carotenoid cleavage dioxygenase-like enzyme
VGRPTRYAYNVHITNDKTLLFDGIVKYDTKQGTSETFLFGPGRAGSEAPFAARLNSKDEDDGYLVSYVWDEREQRSELVILDAKNITAGPVARVILPQRVPHGFHACWVAGSRLPAPRD